MMTIPGCGEISAWTIQAWTDDIKRFASAKKYAAYAGLAPWVQNSNETIRHGKITKRGPKEPRTALVQVVMGLRRQKAKTVTWRLMQRHEAMKKSKIPGKAIVATARKMAVIIWHMLTEEAEFDIGKMVDRKLGKKTDAMSKSTGIVEKALIEREKKPAVTGAEKKGVKKPGVVRKKIKVG